MISLGIKEIIDITGAHCTVKNVVFKGISSLDRASCDDVSFFYRADQKESLSLTNAGACFIQEEHKEWVPPHTLPLVTPHPYRSFIVLAWALNPSPPFSPGRHPTSWIDPCAQVHESCWIGPGAIIQAGAIVGPKCFVDAHTIVGDNVTLAEGCHIESHVTLTHACLDQGVYVGAGTRIGHVGFGFLMDEKGFLDIPHLGKVVIGQGVHIGANCTIDRGTFQNTEIGAFSRIDNLVQIAHNVHIGKYVVIAAQCGIAGSSCIEDGCLLGGQVGLADHIRLGKRTKVAAKSGLMRSSLPGEILAGIPAMPASQWRRYVVQRGKKGQ
jgi:UDP-3-O-[3-hydroxymyristoyl] glucosamine N-acyltransferase